MTTITYRKGIIAADSRATIAGIIILPGQMRKLMVSERHGCVYAIAGAANEASELVRQIDAQPVLPWYSSKPFETTLGEEVQILIGQHDGRLFYFECGYWSEVDAEFTAIGSGMQAAIAAMHMGADAVKAVEIASLCDSGTDGKIASVKLSDLKAPKYFLTAAAEESLPKSRSSSRRSSGSKAQPSRSKAPSAASPSKRLRL